MRAQLVGLIVGSLLTAQSAFAHHPFSAEFDLKKPMTLSGSVSRFVWANPHATVEMKVAGSPAGAWTIELDGASELDRMGWKRDSLAIGDQVKAEGWIAKDGTRRLGAKSVTFKGGRVLPATASFYEATAQGTASKSGLKPNEVAVIGCLQREADYRAIHDKGRGGILGTGIGADKDYVLVEATPVQQPAGAAKSATSPAAARAFKLSGPLEESLVRDIGRTVEIVGVVQKATGEGELPRLTVSLSHPVGDFCPSK